MPVALQDMGNNVITPGGNPTTDAAAGGECLQACRERKRAIVPFGADLRTSAECAAAVVTSMLEEYEQDMLVPTNSDILRCWQLKRDA